MNQSDDSIYVMNEMWSYRELAIQRILNPTLSYRSDVACRWKTKVEPRLYLPLLQMITHIPHYPMNSRLSCYSSPGYHARPSPPWDGRCRCSRTLSSFLSASRHQARSFVQDFPSSILEADRAILLGFPLLIAWTLGFADESRTMTTCHDEFSTLKCDDAIHSGPRNMNIWRLFENIWLICATSHNLIININLLYNSWFWPCIQGNRNFSIVNGHSS